MKFLAFLLPLFLLLSCTAYKDISTSKVTELIEVNGTKDQLFLKSNEWAKRAFANSQSKIQFADKNDGKLVGKFVLNTPNESYYFGDVSSVITITVTDKAAQIEIDPLPWKYTKISLYASVYKPEKAQKDMRKLIESYKSFLESQPAGSESLVSR